MVKSDLPEASEVPPRVWLPGPEAAITSTVLSRSPKVHAHGAPEPPRPTPLGRHEAGFSRRAVNRRAGSEGCGQSGHAREFPGAGLPSKGILSATCLLGESRRMDRLTAGLGRPRDKRKGYTAGTLCFQASEYFILNGN